MIDENTILLKRFMKLDPDELTQEDTGVLLGLIRKCNFLIPVEITSDAELPEDGVVDATTLDKHSHFKPKALKEEGMTHIILFTDEEEIKSNEYTEIMNFNVKDIVQAYRSLPGFDGVYINPFSEYCMGFPFDTFMSIFDDEELKLDSYEELLELFKEAPQIEEDMILYIKEEESFMYNAIKDGIIENSMPVEASLHDEYDEENEVLNKIKLPEGTRLLTLGQEDDYEPVILIPPNTVFKFDEKIDDNMYAWTCINQKFYE
ncbi:SseB family protein [Methanosphaera sp.]